MVLSSCADEDPTPRPPPTTTAPTTTESPEAADEAALRQLAEDWYQAVEAIYLGERDLSDAEDYLADPYLSGFLDQVEEFRASGNRIEITGASGHAVRSVEFNGERATLVECVIDADTLLDASGAPVDDSIQANLYSTVAERTAVGWRLTDRTILSETDGATSCPTE